MLRHLTRRERRRLAQRGIEVEVRDDHRYERKLIIFHVPGEPFEVRWVAWKFARVRGGELKRVVLDGRHRGAFWKLVHENRGGRGWHSQGMTGRLPELVAYAVRYDFFPPEGDLSDLLAASGRMVERGRLRVGQTLIVEKLDGEIVGAVVREEDGTLIVRGKTGQLPPTRSRGLVGETRELRLTSLSHQPKG